MNILTIQAHCSDRSFVTLTTPDGTTYEHDGYVPEDLGIGGGDDVILSIDLDTGKLLDWDKPSADSLSIFMSKSKKVGPADEL